MKTIAIKCQGAATLSIDLMTPLQGSLKTLSETNYKKLRAEIERDGFIEPVSLWENPGDAQIYILNGHQRVATLQRMKLDGFSIPQIPVNWVEAADVNEAKRKVLALASQYGEVTEDGFKEFASGIDFGLDDWKDFVAFPELDLDKIVLSSTPVSAHDRDTTPPPAPGEDDVPPVVEPVAKVGDIFQLGAHRLMCGDSTNRAQVERLISDAKVDILFTDPPYGVSVVKNGTVGGGNVVAPGQYAPIIGDDTTEVAKKSYEVARDLKIEKMIIWGGNYFTDFLPPRASWIVWNKKGEMNSNHFADCELAWTSFKSPARIYDQVWRGMIKEGESGKRVHPTQKPVNLTEWCVRQFAEEARVVLDLFGGSGSTLIACEKMGVSCLMMEFSPAYVDVIIARWEKFTGQKATKVVKLVRRDQ